MSLRSFAFVLVALALTAVPAATAVQTTIETDPPRERVIELASGVLDVDAPLARVSSPLGTTPEDAAAFDYQLVKFGGPVTAEQRQELGRRVDQVYTYLPPDAFLVKLTPAKAATADLSSIGVTWTGPYQPAYKLSPAIQLLSAGDAALDPATSSDLILMLLVYPDANIDAIRERLEAMGIGRVVGSRGGRGSGRIRIVSKPGTIEPRKDDLSRIPEIFWIDLEPRRVLLNDTTVWVSQSGLSGGQTTPIFAEGIHGEGQIVGILDTGIDADMCYFRDTTRGLPPTNACNGGTVTDPLQRKVIAVDFLWSTECSGGISSSEWDSQDHGSHVAGIVAGDNFANPIIHDAGDGMAPGAKLVIQDCGYQVDDCADCPGIGCPVVDLNPIFQQAYTQGARIHTNSWGDEENNPVKGRYTTGSQDADEFMWNHKDFLLVFAAGNDGPGTGSIGSPSTGKNVLSVGATLRSTSANSMASFSSCGPTADGRIKPDLTMPGSSIVSANADRSVTSNNCGTQALSGTSMAAPGAAGSAALVRQYFTEGWYPSGAPLLADAFTPSAALLKATLLNSAVNMTGTTAIPGNCQGWGRVLLDNAMHFAGDSRELFVEDDTVGFAQGSSNEDRTFTLDVGASTEPLKVSLTWTDFPATPLAAVTLVNDLDLTVTTPGGTVYRGNVFASGASTTGGSADRRNSVEQVLIPSPATGTYTVTVRSFTVPSGPQPFAVVATGSFGTACSPQPIANAGNDVTITSGQSTTIGTAAQAGHSYSWSPGGATTAQVSVSPTTTTTYTVTATTACGSANDSVTVTVNPPAGCTLTNFTSSADGWISSAASTCTQGRFVRAVPTSVVNGGVTTQPAGDHTTGSGNAFFTAVNTAAGTHDVDGGNCIAESTTTAITQASTVSLWYFHGQRDTTTDANDFFRVEISSNGGTTWTNMVSIGNVRTNAVWTQVSANVAAGAQLKLRVQVSDGTASGDLIEGGIDDVQVCPTTPRQGSPIQPGRP